MGMDSGRLVGGEAALVIGGRYVDQRRFCVFGPCHQVVGSQRFYIVVGCVVELWVVLQRWTIVSGRLVKLSLQRVNVAC